MRAVEKREIDIERMIPAYMAYIPGCLRKHRRIRDAKENKTNATKENGKERNPNQNGHLLILMDDASLLYSKSTKGLLLA